jgi:hypothetical protein
MIDLAFLAAAASILGPLIAAIWRFFSVISRLEREIEKGRTERRLLKERTDAALRLMDHRIREVEQTLSAALDFTPRFQRDEGCSTGASFLEDDVCPLEHKNSL